MVSALAWLGVPLFAATAYFNADQGGFRVLAAIVAMAVCFVVAVSGTGNRPSYGVDCRNYSVFASDC